MLVSLVHIIASDGALGKWLGAGLGVMLLVMGGLGLRNYLYSYHPRHSYHPRRRHHPRPPADRTPE